MENLESALLLLVVGMGTVFTILTMVVLSGKLIINITNSYLPEEIPTKKSINPKNGPLVSPQMVAVLSASVSIATKGEGRVVEITKSTKNKI
ncbi:OadG family protein [Flammeovirga sp. MY04]|nr:OadG family protein [Flammeovirga sp. MY04]NMF38689.1 OadG family protein [Flammeovirga yaeyamensis]